MQGKVVTWSLYVITYIIQIYPNKQNVDFENLESFFNGNLNARVSSFSVYSVVRIECSGSNMYAFLPRAGVSWQLPLDQHVHPGRTLRC